MTNDSSQGKDADWMKKFLENVKSDQESQTQSQELDQESISEFLKNVKSDQESQTQSQELDQESISEFLKNVKSDQELQAQSQELDQESISEFLKEVEFRKKIEPREIQPEIDATEEDVANWMLETINARGELRQKTAVLYIKEKYGKKFISINKNGNDAIKREVLNAFEEIASTSVIWVKSKHFWRLRRPGDPTGKRQV